MENILLTDDEKALLKNLAKLALEEAVKNNRKVAVDSSKLPKIFTKKLGAFVTLHKDSKLRGCIGRFEPDQALYEVVIDMAISASRYDTRFRPVSEDELDSIDIEISVLTPRRKINSIDEIIIGKHGIYVEYGARNGTYLPQVATDMGWDAKEFFRSCCEEKAGIDPADCPKATIYVYEAIVF